MRVIVHVNHQHVLVCPVTTNMSHLYTLLEWFHSSSTIWFMLVSPFYAPLCWTFCHLLHYTNNTYRLLSAFYNTKILEGRSFASIYNSAGFFPVVISNYTIRTVAYWLQSLFMFTLTLTFTFLLFLIARKKCHCVLSVFITVANIKV